jgi:hypothetical protein
MRRYSSSLHASKSDLDKRSAFPLLSTPPVIEYTGTFILFSTKQSHGNLRRASNDWLSNAADFTWPRCRVPAVYLSHAFLAILAIA